MFERVMSKEPLPSKKNTAADVSFAKLDLNNNKISGTAKTKVKIFGHDAQSMNTKAQQQIWKKKTEYQSVAIAQSDLIEMLWWNFKRTVDKLMPNFKFQVLWSYTDKQCNHFFGSCSSVLHVHIESVALYLRRN